MSRSSTPLATTRSKMERASRDTKKKSPLPHDDQAPRREGIFVLGEQDTHYTSNPSSAWPKCSK